MTNLEKMMRDSANDTIYSISDFDADTYREALQEVVGSVTDSACTYYSHCQEVISRYETDPRASDADDLLDGTKYAASEWQQAMAAYASAIAYSVTQAVAAEMADEAKRAADDLQDLATTEGANDVTIKCANDCPYGWAAHDYETAHGAMVWKNIEGCRAVAIRTGGIWLHAIWTPEIQDAEPTD